jgi:hypothetical protein
MSAVLQEVDAERRAPVALDVIHSRNKAWSKEHRRPPALTPREALAAIKFEALLVWTACANVRNGVVLGDADFERLSTACRWIEVICSEAGA